ncbi:MAG: hypothetical protein KA314_04510 [Chloroflexi bacterium]|nr:hypothetical protein [Chloroflexota bacterium]
MSDTALTPIRQQQILFYDDEITAVQAQQGDKVIVLVPVRPLCDFLGIDWSAQLQRLRRDPVLSTMLSGVVITPTPLSPFSNPQEMICLPLTVLNGWLFGVNSSRVKPELREKLIRYQREVYEILAAAFLDRPLSADSSPNAAALIQIREMGRAIMTMAEEQLKFEARLTTVDQRLDKAAYAFADLTKRINVIEQKLTPANVITEEQASQLSQAVKTIALELAKKSGRPEFGAVYGEMYRRYGITGYKFLPANQFADAINWLNRWFQELTNPSGSAF